ncbi:hypothetical protein UlMin_045121 [Ulmus minor]
MDYHHHLSNFLVLFIIWTTSSILSQQNQSQAHKIALNRHHYGPATNVTKTLHFPNFNPKSTPQIKLLGNARLTQHQPSIQIPDSSQAVDLTYQVGRAIYSSPIRLFDPLTKTPSSFHTTFSFQLNTTTNSGQNKSISGGGFAFIIVSDEFTVGRPGPWLGILSDACNHHMAFAVEFDTSHDREVGDPNDDHIGINLGAVVSFKTANLSEAKISLHDSSVLRTWIIYNGETRVIDVYLGFDGNPIPRIPTLSTPLNLSPFLNEYMFVGFSASTGNSTQIHNIFSWNFSSNGQAFVRSRSTKICPRNLAKQVSKYSIFPHYNPPSSFTIFVAVIGTLTISCLSFYFNSQRRSQTSPIVFLEKKQRPRPPSKPRRFTGLELERATRRFSKSEVLGSDSRGVLYRATLRKGCRLAAKRFSNQNSSPVDWSRVLKRIGELTRVSHPSLAPIRGWCCDSETIIVYDYYQNGSVDRWLFGFGAIPWTRRVQLVKEVAESLSYLHSKQLAHGNVKMSSVFLDVDYKAVLGDYGFVSFGGNRIVTEKKEDVFEFGLLVVEIVAGKTVAEVEDGIRRDIGVLEFAMEMFERGEILQVVDERLRSCVDPEEAVRVLRIGLSCSTSQLEKRPSMEEVVHLLNQQI